MKKTMIAGLLMGAVMMLGFSSNADASSVLNIFVGATSVASCNNSSVGGVIACGLTGFSTSLNSNSIVFTGAITGYTVGSISMAGNAPGTALAGNVLDSKFSVTHTSGTDDLIVQFGSNDFTLPVGPGLFLSAADSATFGQSVSTDFGGFQAWGKADDTLTIPGGTATAIAPNCVPGAGVSTSCATVTSDVPFTRVAGNYSLTGQETIHLAIGELPASFSATVAANAQPTSAPEAPSVMLLGMGLVFLGVSRKLISI